VINAVVGDGVNRRFNIGHPSTQYGQKMSVGLYGLVNRILGRTMVIPTITLDSVLDMVTRPTLVHMDVQGEELNVLKSCKRLSDVSYLIVGVHKREYSGLIPKVLSPTHNILFNLLPKSITKTGIGTVATQDGVILAKRLD
jgi:hypothetical protein